MRLLPLLLGFVFSFPSLQAEELYQAKPIGGEIIASEGPLVDGEGNLYFCSIQAKDGSQFDRNVRGSIGILRPGADQAEIWLELPEGSRFNGMRLTPWGTLLGADAVGKRVAEVDLETQEVTTYFAFPEGSDKPNDLTIAKDGTIYVSLPPKAIWRITRDAEGQVEGKLVGESFANGLTLNVDETRLFTQQGGWSFDEEGMLVRDPEARLRIPRDKEKFSFMDGMRFDQGGNLYMARAGARVGKGPQRTRTPAVIHIFGPDGQWIRDVELPGGAVFNLTFGGPDGKTVYAVLGGEGIATFRTESPGRLFAE